VILRIGLLVLALAAALAPLPAPLVESWYASRVYPSLQPAVTGLSNRAPFAFFDALIAAAAVWLVATAVRIVRGPRKGSRLFAAFRASANVAALAAVVYLAFLLLWGLNYRRVPLDQRVDFARTRVTPAAARSLAAKVVERANVLQGQLPRASWPDWPETAETLKGPFSRVQRQLGAGWVARPGRPKWSILSFYFERAAVDGMTDPFFLEVLVNRSLLPFERPAVLAHEWAHLAGYAGESEASFVGWLSCLQGPPALEYSAHLSLLWHLLPGLPAAEREAITRQLRQGARDDLRAIARRLESTSPAVRRVAWRAYDGYLKANRVEQGVRSYGQAVDLMLGTRLSDTWVPALARAPGM
jgi:hypothetical protein